MKRMRAGSEAKIQNLTLVNTDDTDLNRDLISILQEVRFSLLPMTAIPRDDGDPKKVQPSRNIPRGTAGFCLQ
jgi:hypothetical protein